MIIINFDRIQVPKFEFESKKLGLSICKNLQIGNENNCKTKLLKCTEPLYDYNPKITIIIVIFN